MFSMHYALTTPRGQPPLSTKWRLMKSRARTPGKATFLQ
jgi:hypothetical protein